jgi:hypothetical protein
MGEKGQKGQKIGKKDEKRVISVPRSFARPLPDGKLKNQKFLIFYFILQF